MPSTESDAGTLASSLHRSILGFGLAVLGILGVGLARQLLTGEYLVGVAGVGIALGAGYWILSLFLEGLHDR
ncbi:hypothetical protein [Halocatena marina]|uniref:Major facilitator superfamily (MFS) profile domain-containing protein n=1 Tax=Halocatena marina TaxID=2934937 RepID=A0ABD5YQB5_9EURY|nr:hypothetical protein [Halocatena marina]